MRKLIALLLVLSLTLGIGMTAANAEDIHLIMAWWGNQSRNQTFNAILDMHNSVTPCQR